MNKILSQKKGKCQNCREDNQELFKVKIIKKGKEEIVGWCELCLRGWMIHKGISDRDIDNYFE